MKKLGVLILLISSINALAQVKRDYKDNTNAWYMYFGSHKFSNKWGLHIEAQYRMNEIIERPQQLLLRAGINHHFNASAFATVGYCFVNTYPYGTLPANSIFPENRIWEQLQLKNQIGRVENITRFRLEQRYVNAPVSTATGFAPGPEIYTNRFRLLARFSISLNSKEIQDKSFYISAYDELFISFGENVAYNIFDQNRAYLAFGYKIPKIGRLEIGYLNQLIVKGNGIQVENNHTLQIGLSSNIDLYKKKE